MQDIGSSNSDSWTFFLLFFIVVSCVKNVVWSLHSVVYIDCFRTILRNNVRGKQRRRAITISLQWKVVLPSTSRKYLTLHGTSDCKTALDGGCLKPGGTPTWKGQGCSLSRIQIKGFWSHLGCWWRNVTKFSCQIILQGALQEIIRNALI